MNHLAMSELFLNELILSKEKKITFNVNNRMRLIECNNLKIKNILDLLLKSGKLPEVKAQIVDLPHKGNCPINTLGIIKFFMNDEEIEFSIKELKAGIDFSWEVIRNIKQ